MDRKYGHQDEEKTLLNLSLPQSIHAPRFLLAAPKSGSGKTFVTCGILQLLKDKGKEVRAFKCGPDYIDPMFHRTVLGLPSKNLDTFFAGEALTASLFAEGAKGADISVMEGVMGYFDGVDLPDHPMLASAYDLARSTKTPVILVVDAKGMSRSVVAMIKGFLDYGKEPTIRGVILNRIAPGMFPLFKEMIETELGIPAIGYLPRMEGALWESRHLGLVQPEEIRELQSQVERIAGTLSETLDLPLLLKIAEEAEDLSVRMPDITPLPEAVRIGVARDAAFSFYYEDNLRLLTKLGAELIEFSPLTDSVLPKVRGLILGGGYPELYGGELSENKSMLQSIRAAAASGMPILAECGGFMYLQKELVTKEGERFSMVGALPGETRMGERLVRFGYITLTPNAENGNGLGEDIFAGASYLAPGETIRGHEFHYFDSTDNGASCIAKKPKGGRQWECMVSRQGIFAGYPHLYYYSDPDFAKRFLEKCAAYHGRTE